MKRLALAAAVLALAAFAAGPVRADQTFYHASTGPNPGVATPRPNASGGNIEYIYPPYYGQPCLRNGHYVDCRCPRGGGWDRCRPWFRPRPLPTTYPGYRQPPYTPVPRPIQPLQAPGRLQRIAPPALPAVPPVRAWPGFGSPAPTQA